MTEPLILVLNAGSSSLKFSLFRAGAGEVLDLTLRGQLDGGGTPARLTITDHAGRTLEERNLTVAETQGPAVALQIVGEWLDRRLAGGRLAVVGHRVVHGGVKFSRPLRLDDTVEAELERLVPLAPLHQPHNLAAMRAVRQWQPDVPQVACFDTAFHRPHPPLADLYALPWEFYEAGVRRYGFHGLSYEFISMALPRVAPELARGRVVVAHLGSGASLCALNAGRSVDSTMGFSVLDGVPMGTRTGSLDPGVLLYLLRERGLSVSELETLLYHQSGLLGLSGISSDMRQLLASPAPRANLAVDYFVHRVAQEIAALAASLGGLDALVFTAGIGENSPEIRARIVTACEWLGLQLDLDANSRGGPRISAAEGRVSAWVIPTNEELMIARHAWSLIRSGASDGPQPPPG